MKSRAEGVSNMPPLFFSLKMNLASVQKQSHTQRLYLSLGLVTSEVEAWAVKSTVQLHSQLKSKAAGETQFCKEELYASVGDNSGFPA